MCTQLIDLTINMFMILSLLHSQIAYQKFFYKKLFFGYGAPHISGLPCCSVFVLSRQSMLWMLCDKVENYRKETYHASYALLKVLKLFAHVSGQWADKGHHTA